MSHHWDSLILNKDCDGCELLQTHASPSPHCRRLQPRRTLACYLIVSCLVHKITVKRYKTLSRRTIRLSPNTYLPFIMVHKRNGMIIHKPFVALRLFQKHVPSQSEAYKSFSV